MLVCTATSLWVGVLAAGQLSVVPGCLGAFAGLGAGYTAADKLRVTIKHSQNHWG